MSIILWQGGQGDDFAVADWLVAMVLVAIAAAGGWVLRGVKWREPQRSERGGFGEISYQKTISE